jgi:hypothetical protein
LSRHYAWLLSRCYQQDAAKRLIEIARQVEFVSNITDLVRPDRRLVREVDPIDIVYLSKKERFSSPRALYLVIIVLFFLPVVVVVFVVC